MCVYLRLCVFYCVGSEKFIDNVLSLADTEPSFIMCGVSTTYSVIASVVRNVLVMCTHTHTHIHTHTHTHTTF